MGTAIFRAESHRPFELFFARARGPRRGCGRKRVRGRGETLQRFKSSRDTHESTSHLRTLRTPTPPFRVTLRSISRYGPPFVGSLSDQRAPMILIFHLCSLARLGFIYLLTCVCAVIRVISIGNRSSSMHPIRKWNRVSVLILSNIAHKGVLRSIEGQITRFYQLDISMELILMLYECIWHLGCCISYWYLCWIDDKEINDNSSDYLGILIKMWNWKVSLKMQREWKFERYYFEQLYFIE